MLMAHTGAVFETNDKRGKDKERFFSLFLEQHGIQDSTIEMTATATLAVHRKGA